MRLRTEKGKLIFVVSEGSVFTCFAGAAVLHQEVQRETVQSFCNKRHIVVGSPRDKQVGVQFKENSINLKIHEAVLVDPQQQIVILYKLPKVNKPKRAHVAITDSKPVRLLEGDSVLVFLEGLPINRDFHKLDIQTWCLSGDVFLMT